MKTEQSEFVAYVGLDRADRKHDLCLQVGEDARKRTEYSMAPQWRKAPLLKHVVAMANQAVDFPLVVGLRT